MENHSVLGQFFRAVLHELFRSKTFYNLIASVTLLAFVIGGYLWQESYTSSATVGVEQLGINHGGNDPALANEQFERLEAVYTSRSFQDAVIDALPEQMTESLVANADKRTFFDQHTHFVMFSHNVLGLSFVAATPELAQQSLQILLDTLLQELRPSPAIVTEPEQDQALVSEEQRLKEQLTSQQQALELLRQNDATLSPRSRERVASLREAMQDTEVNISAVIAKLDAIRRQLEKEEELYRLRSRLEVLEAQKTKTSGMLQEYLMIYPSTAPEVVSLQHELDNINSEIASLNDNQLIVANKDKPGISLYEQLRKQLALEELERDALLSRHESLEKILINETRKEDANQSQLSELLLAEKLVAETRQAYDQVVRKREQLKQQQSVVQVPAFRFLVMDAPGLPATYSGLGLVEFLMLGPLIAFGLPVVTASAVVLSDTRIRTSHGLRTITPRSIPVLGVIPHYNSPVTSRIFRKALAGMVLWAMFIFSVYVTAGVIELKGW